MLIYLNCPTSPGDWFIVELQGEVSVEGLGDDPNFNGLTFADLTQVDVRIYISISFQQFV